MSSTHDSKGYPSHCSSVTSSPDVTLCPGEQCDTSYLEGTLGGPLALHRAPFLWENSLHPRLGASAHAEHTWDGKHLTVGNGLDWAGREEVSSAGPFGLGYDFKGPCFEIMRPPKKHAGAKNDCKR